MMIGSVDAIFAKGPTGPHKVKPNSFFFFLINKLLIRQEKIMYVLYSITLWLCGKNFVNHS